MEESGDRSELVSAQFASQWRDNRRQTAVNTIYISGYYRDNRRQTAVNTVYQQILQ